MSQFEPSVAQMRPSANVSQAMKDFLVAQRVRTTMDYGLSGGGNESKLDSTLVQHIKAAEASLDTITVRIFGK